MGVNVNEMPKLGFGLMRLPEKEGQIDLDQVCRMQQVHDGCFRTFDDVPKQAFTMTIPQLTDAVEHIICTVPGPTKTEATYRMLRDEISTALPATALRRHRDSVLVLDVEAAKKILPEK